MDTIKNIEELKFRPNFDNSVIETVLVSNLLPPVIPKPPLPPSDPFTGTAGNNTIIGNAAGNVLRGFDGNDVLKGLAGNDTVYGGNGSDVLSGGNGKDTLWGGAGKDFFVFDFKPNKSTNVDAIRDFRVVDDTIRMENAVFTKIDANGVLKAVAFWSNNTGKAHDKDDRIIHDKDSGVLYYDADGSGPGAAVAFATITKNLALTYKDFAVI